MKEPSQSWIQRLLPHYKYPKSPDTAQRAGISSDALRSAQSAIKGIPNAQAQIEINAVLDVIMGIDIKREHGENTLLELESYIRYLAELFEPFAWMDPPKISGNLHYAVRKLSGNLQAISLKSGSESSSGLTHRFFNRQEDKQDMGAFTQDFKSVLDRFRVVALKLYPISPIEATLLSLGIIMSDCSCGLRPFLACIFQNEQIMDYRIGTVQSVQLYRSRRPETGLYEFLLIELLNRRGIGNWVRIEPKPTSTRGIVSFATTKEPLILGAATRMSIVMDDSPLMTNLAMEIRTICEVKEQRAKFSANGFFGALRPYGRLVPTRVATRRGKELFRERCLEFTPPPPDSES